MGTAGALTLLTVGTEALGSFSNGDAEVADSRSGVHIMDNNGELIEKTQGSPSGTDLGKASSSDALAAAMQALGDDAKAHQEVSDLVSTAQGGLSTSQLYQENQQNFGIYGESGLSQLTSKLANYTS